MQKTLDNQWMKPSASLKRLRDDPVNAAKRTDRTPYFLTSTQLEQIRHWASRGRVADAAKMPCPRIRKK
ncbi:phage tail tape measure protein [Salmonella enterica subsp. enterica]|nr:phage tail tape measure protein [Salmonella enterica subsp. enterica]